MNTEILREEISRLEETHISRILVQLVDRIEELEDEVETLQLQATPGTRE